MEQITFDQFCHEYCDGLYTPDLPRDKQCTGYNLLLKMINENITPATIDEAKAWEEDVTQIFKPVDIKYLRFLHVNLRPFIIEHWHYIKRFKTNRFIKRGGLKISTPINEDTDNG